MELFKDKSKKKIIFAFLFAFLLALFFIFYILTPYKYEHFRGMLIRINRITGKTEVFVGYKGWKPIKSNRNEVETTQLYLNQCKQHVKALRDMMTVLSYEIQPPNPVSKEMINFLNAIKKVDIVKTKEVLRKVVSMLWPTYENLTTDEKEFFLKYLASKPYLTYIFITVLDPKFREAPINMQKKAIKKIFITEQ